MFAILQSTLDAFWRRRTITVKNGLITLKSIYEVGYEVLGIVEGLPYMRPFPLRDEIGMGVECYALLISHRKGNYVGSLQLGSMSKTLTE